MRFVPTKLALLLVWPVTLVIFLLATPQRRAILTNLRALRPDFGPVERWWAGFRVFLNFALTYLDRLWSMHFGREVTWDVPNTDRFACLRNHPGGVLIFTIHSGNYDIGASLFAREFGRRLHTVRAPEQTEELQRLREKELRQTEQENPRLRVHYNFGDNHLGLELCRVLLEGDAVAVQGDRVLSAVSPVAMACNGRVYQLPRGPLVLAEISRVPCYPIFLERTGCLRYRIHVGECFHDGAARLRSDDIGRLWLPVMHQHLQEHWDQWFVFEPLVSLQETGPSA
jgi:predicted LPLAT superfamily acyltransferase